MAIKTRIWKDKIADLEGRKVRIVVGSQYKKWNLMDFLEGFNQWIMMTTNIRDHISEEKWNQMLMSHLPHMEAIERDLYSWHLSSTKNENNEIAEIRLTLHDAMRGVISTMTMAYV